MFSNAVEHWKSLKSVGTYVQNGFIKTIYKLFGIS